MARTPVATDDFDRANGAVGSNWGYIRDTAWQSDPPDIVSNKVTGRALGANYQVIRWVGAGSFNDDQYAVLEIGGLGWQGADYRQGVVVRCSADTNTNADYYAYWVQDDDSTNRTTKLVKVVNGTATELDSAAVAWTNGDTIELEVEGTTLRGYRNGTLILTDTDSDLSTGVPGLMISGVSSYPTADNWVGGDISADAVALSLPLSFQASPVRLRY